MDFFILKLKQMKLLNYAPFLLVIAILAGCAPAEESTAPTEEEIIAESARANEFFENVFNEQVSRSPMFQTQLGMKTDYDKWDDLSDENDQEELEITKQKLQWLTDSINYDLLDDQTKISYDLFVINAEDDIRNFGYRFHNYPINQMFGLHSNIPSFLINMHRITEQSDAEAYIKRIEGTGPLFDQLIENLKIREEKGIVPPQFVFPRVLDDSRNIISGAPFDGGAPSAILADFNGKVDGLEIEEADKDGLKQQASEALTNYLKPAYERLIAFLEDQQSRATADDGVWKFPQGEEFYNNALRNTTTTELSADEIHEIGLAEVERIHGQMRGIMEKVGFDGTLQEFFKFMQTDDQFYYPNTDEGKEEYMAKATEIIDNMRDRLDELFIRKPQAEMIVKRVEAFREKSAGKAFYNRPAPDGSRPGIYYANLYDSRNMPKYEMEALAYHEGIPGHHMQLAIAQELEGIPKFRKFGGYTAYIEGWGLYTEYIPKEMGLYEDPYSDFGRLAMELWRACRLVVDTGIHSKQWTREQGIEYYRSNTPGSDRETERMVERHIVIAGQATAYKIGMLKIQELRGIAEQQLGDDFDVRQFHDVVLKNGPIPLNVLEKVINDWIEEQSTPSE